MRIQTSIAGKITFGYYFIVAVILSLSAFTFSELYQLEHQLASGERISGFLNTTLESRRFEKNYFLYGQTGDLEQAVQYAHAAEALLEQHAPDFLPLRGVDALQQLTADLRRYSGLMQQLLQSGTRIDATDQRLEEGIRGMGQRVVGAAEQMSGIERRILQADLIRSRTLLLGTVLSLVVVGVVTGRLLSRHVVRTLQQLETRMDRVAEGRMNALNIDSHDREIVALTRAFNHVLDELELKHAHLVRSQKLAALGTLLSGVAHELNNPLSNISTSSQILSEEIEDGDLAYQRSLLEQIDEQVERSRLIVRSLLEFARERPSRKEPLAIRALAEDAWRFVRGEIPSGVTVRLDIPADLVVVADKQRLQQVLLNLLNNAIEAVGNRGRIDITAAQASERWPHGRCSAEDHAAEICVRDSGPGIDPAILANIFDPFFTTKEVGRGSGLGLALVHEIIEEHDGCIAAESGPGGTVFRLRLPLANREPDLKGESTDE